MRPTGGCPNCRGRGRWVPLVPPHPCRILLAGEDRPAACPGTWRCMPRLPQPRPHPTPSGHPPPPLCAHCGGPTLLNALTEEVDAAVGWGGCVLQGGRGLAGRQCKYVVQAVRGAGQVRAAVGGPAACRASLLLRAGYVYMTGPCVVNGHIRTSWCLCRARPQVGTAGHVRQQQATGHRPQPACCMCRTALPGSRRCVQTTNRSGLPGAPRGFARRRAALPTPVDPRRSP